MENEDVIDAHMEQIGGNIEGKEITIKVSGPNNGETAFKLKMTTDLRKLMERYTQDHGVQFRDYRFVMDGVRVIPGDTPQKLNMESGDVITVFYGSIGRWLLTQEIQGRFDLRRRI